MIRLSALAGSGFRTTCGLAGIAEAGGRLDVIALGEWLHGLRHEPPAAALTAQRATTDSLRQRLDTARAEITRLKAENRSLRDQLARQLGLQRTQHAKNAPAEPR